MPVIEVSFAHMRKLVGEKATRRAILDALPYLGLDIESETAGSARIEYSPNRADYCTDYGIALGLEGLLGLRESLAPLAISDSDRTIHVDPSVADVRPYITAICALDGEVDQHLIKQLITMQEDLHFGIGRKRKKSSIGIHDLDTIQFPLSYTTILDIEQFTPLHHEKPLLVSQIIQETEMGKTHGHLLGNYKRIPAILDVQSILSIPPIINASKTAINTNTKNIFVEVTGLNKDDVEDALSIIAITLQRAGFKLSKVNISGAKNATPKFLQKKMMLDPELVNSTLGLELSVPDIISCLKKSRLDASQVGKKIQCIIPRYRFDIFGEMDLVEEVALGYGISKMEPQLAPFQTIGDIHHTTKQLYTLDDMMIGLGYTEALNSSLTSPAIHSEQAISVLDSKSGEHTILRRSILPSLLNNLSSNVHQAYPQRLYETGTVFMPADPISEKINLAAICAYKNANFTEIKSILESALNVGFGISVKTKTSKNLLFEDGRCADIVRDETVIGVIGHIRPEELERFKIRMPVVGFEVGLSGLIFD